MRFGPVALVEASGAILAHSIDLPDGRLRKGRVLDAADLDRLRAAGLDEITVARPESRDVPEDAAAARLAAALVPDPDAAGLRIGAAATGRANLYATGPGVLRVAAEAIHAINAVDPAITVATLPEWARMEAGAMAATVKIIAYAAPEAAVMAACVAARGAVRLCPPVHRSAALIQTAAGTGTPDKGERAIRTRLDRLGATLAESCTVPHAIAPLARAIAQTRAGIVLILTASATSDLHDTAPEALRRAGGTVARFGMPVDPGNLLFLGTLGDRPVIGLPGCARSPALNGADWVLERVICGVPPTAGDIARMGVGGLLKESPARPHPRRRSG